jgi:hypothetical protein
MYYFFSAKLPHHFDNYCQQVIKYDHKYTRLIMKRLFRLLVFFVAAQASAQEYGEIEDHYKLLESIDGHYIPKDKVLLREKVFREFKGIGYQPSYP